MQSRDICVALVAQFHEHRQGHEHGDVPGEHCKSILTTLRAKLPSLVRGLRRRRCPALRPTRSLLATTSAADPPPLHPPRATPTHPRPAPHVRRPSFARIAPRRYHRRSRP